MEKSFCSCKGMKVFIEYCQCDHDQHRRQNESAHGNRSPAPTPQTEADVGNRIAGTGTRKTLSKRYSFGKLRICYPAPLANGGGADLRQDRDAAAKSD